MTLYYRDSILSAADKYAVRVIRATMHKTSTFVSKSDNQT